MKRRWITGLAVLAVLGGTGFIGSTTITTEQELDDDIARLHDPEKEISALERLIKFSGIFLYETSMVYVTDDHKMDNLRRKARKALRDRRDPDIVGIALKHEDRDVRFWGVMSFEIIHGQRDPWKRLVPQLKAVAVKDTDSNIRSEAIRRLRYYDTDFIHDLRTRTTESSPWVLMNLFSFDSGKPELRMEFYHQAVIYLSHDDPNVRKRWLTYLHMNAWNPSTAEMWRIESDPRLIAELKEIEASGSPKERELATKTINALSERKQERTQQDAAEQPATPGEFK